jgi:non-specific serine/threonine protein kinase
MIAVSRRDVIAARSAPLAEQSLDAPSVKATLRLTPQGKLVFEDHSEAPELDARIALRLREAFATGSGEGLWRLGACEAGAALPPVFVWWRDFAARFVTALRRQPRESDEPIGDAIQIEPLTPAEFASLTLTTPIMAGAEYLNATSLHALWQGLEIAFTDAFSAAKTDLQSSLAHCNPAWTLVGNCLMGVCFTLRASWQCRKDGAVL